MAITLPGTLLEMVVSSSPTRVPTTSTVRSTGSTLLRPSVMVTTCSALGCSAAAFLLQPAVAREMARADSASTTPVTAHSARDGDGDGFSMGMLVSCGCGACLGRLTLSGATLQCRQY